MQKAHEIEQPTEQAGNGKKKYKVRKSSKNHQKAHKAIIDNQMFAYRADSAPHAVSPDTRKR